MSLTQLVLSCFLWSSRTALAFNGCSWNTFQKNTLNTFGLHRNELHHNLNQYKTCRNLAERGDSRLFVSGGESSSSESWEREWNLENNDDSLAFERKERIRIEKINQARFLQGDELYELREKVEEMKKELKNAVKTRDGVLANEITKEMTSLLKQDAEYVYAEASKKLEKARFERNELSVEAYKQEAIEARSSIPHFNLEGLWVGKYGSHGYEMINVTYVEDTLIAYKVTGDKNVPKGEITFKADLSPNANTVLEPIELTSAASKQWGMKHLIRFLGKGQVAAEGFLNAQWMEGQLIMVGNYFSFAWVPIGHQIFFGRPSADLTLKMLKASESVTADADVEKMREFAMRCLEETIILEEECTLDIHSGGCFE